MHRVWHHCFPLRMEELISLIREIRSNDSKAREPIFVLMTSGSMSTTLIPKLRTSILRESVKASIANLLAQYHPLVGITIKPATEPTLIIYPDLLFRM